MITIHRFGIFSLGKFYAAVSALFGLLGGLFISAMSLLGLILGGSSQSAYRSSYQTGYGFLDIVTGLGAIICFPLLYGIMGFISGIITGVVVNIALKICNGIEIEAIGFSLQPGSPKETQPKLGTFSPLPQQPPDS